MQRISMHFCTPIASRPSWTDRANENIITSHKSNLSILRIKGELIRKFFSACRISTQAFVFCLPGRKKLVCTIFLVPRHRYSQRSSSIFIPYPFSFPTLFFPPSTLPARTLFDFPRGGSQLRRFFARLVCFFYVVAG